LTAVGITIGGPGGFSWVKDRRAPKNALVLSRVVLLKTSSAGASPTAGLGGPCNVPPSLTDTKVPLGLNVVLLALRNDPARDMDGEILSERLLIEIGPAPVVTLLPLNWIRGFVDVLFNLDPSTTDKRLLKILKVLPESLSNGPASVTVAGPCAD
jgi:hypothetical protein